MRRNTLEASAIARSPRSFVVSPSLIFGEQHQARSSFMVKDQTAYHLGSWTIQNICQSGRTDNLTHCRRSSGRSPRRCPSQPT